MVGAIGESAMADSTATAAIGAIHHRACRCRTTGQHETESPTTAASQPAREKLANRPMLIAAPSSHHSAARRGQRTPSTGRHTSAIAR